MQSPWHQVNTMGQILTQMDISNSGEVNYLWHDSLCETALFQALCFGDTGGVVHLWSDRSEFTVHRNLDEHILVPRVPPPAPFQFDSNSPFTSAGNVLQSATPGTTCAFLSLLSGCKLELLPGPLASSWVPTSRLARKHHHHGPFRVGLRVYLIIL